MLPLMPSCPRLLATLATAFALSACNSSGDKSTLRVSLGSTLQALTVESVTIDRFELTVVCVDGSEVTERGDIADDGTFEAEVSNCPQASIRFRGLTTTARPALHGLAEAAIRPPSTELVVPVRRVGTVSIVNDDTYTAVCAINAPGNPELEAAFILSPGAAREQVLPTIGVTLSCAPADTCGDVDTCDFSGPLATTRAVAVSFGGESTLSLANLSNSLIFTIGPPSPHSAGGTFGPFEVSLIDEIGQPISRDDITVQLVAESSVANGGFQNGVVQTTGGVARFSGVRFTTAGSLVMRAQADVDGVLLQTEIRTIPVLAGPATRLTVTGPTSATAGVGVNLDVTGVDAFGNLTAAPSSLVVSSDDQIAVGFAVAGFNGEPLPFTFFQAGRRTLTVRSSTQSSVAGTVEVDVVAAAAFRLDLSIGAGNYVTGQAITFRVIARDNWNNLDRNYTGTVSLNPLPAGDFTYGGSHVFTPADGGRFDFTGAQFSSVGTRTVTATDGNFTSNSVNLNISLPGTLDHFEVILGTTSVSAGQPFDVTVRAVDAANTLVNTFVGTVTVASPGGCNGIFTIDFAMNGELTQQLTCRLVGTWRLEADYAAAHFGTSQPITVTPGNPYALGIIQAPPPVVGVNQPFAMAVEIFDSEGNAADPRQLIALGLTLELSLGDAAGSNLNGTTPVFVGNVVMYPGLVIDSPAGGATITVAVNPPTLEVSGQVTPPIVVTAAVCPTTFVLAGVLPGQGNPCDDQDPVGSIQEAIDAVDAGGQVRVAEGNYTGQSVSITKALKLLGGFDSSFALASRDPLVRNTVLKGATGAAVMGTVEVGPGGYVLIDGFLIEAGDTSNGTFPKWAVMVSGSAGNASLWLDNNRLIGPVVTNAIDGGGVVNIGDVGRVIIRNNWIHTGGAPGGQALGIRDGIAGGVAPGSVDIVHNTIYVADAESTQAVYFGGLGTYTFTNNLVLGDFRDCGLGVGVCVIRESESSLSLASVLNNYVFQQNPTGALLYQTRFGGMLDSLNALGPPRFMGNVNQLNGGILDTILVLAGGPDDGFLYTMQDNDWHLVDNLGFAIGLDATQPFCGDNNQSLCGGTVQDIDGDVKPVPACVGADEYTVTVPG